MMPAFCSSRSSPNSALTLVKSLAPHAPYPEIHEQADTSFLSQLATTVYSTCNLRNIRVSRMGIWLKGPSHGWPGRSLTQENDDAGEDGDQRPGAQAGVQDVGFRVAGQQRPVHVTPTDLDGEGVGAAHGRDPTVTDHDGQEVQILLLPTEPSAPGIHARGIICGKRGEKAHLESKARASQPSVCSAQLG